MGCCDHASMGDGVSIDYNQLPEQTFCCMARVAYMTAVAAEELLCGRKHPTWHALNERQRLDLAYEVKSALTGDYEGTTPMTKLMVVLIRAMTIAS